MTHGKRSSHAARTWIAIAAACAVYLSGFSLVVDTQSPAPAPPQQAPQAAPVPEPGAPDPGRGGRGGRGLGGPGATDPANAEADYSPQAPVVPLPPKEQATRFVLPPGYQHGARPDRSRHPGAGRDRVRRQRPHVRRSRLRGYMQDADAGGELDPIGRISRARRRRQRRRLREALRLRRQAGLPALRHCRSAPNSVLTMESNADEVWKYTDTNNDGVADKKELFATDFGRAGNVEHQQAFLTWAHGQLAVQHRQRVPRALDAERRC